MDSPTLRGLGSGFFVNGAAVVPGLHANDPANTCRPKLHTIVIYLKQSFYHYSLTTWFMAICRM